MLSPDRGYRLHFLGFIYKAILDYIFDVYSISNVIKRIVVKHYEPASFPDSKDPIKRSLAGIDTVTGATSPG